MEFKCLFCLYKIRDGDLTCVASCDHNIHDYCIETMRTLNEHDCKICKKTVGVSLVFKEFDMARSTSISGMEVVINKLNEIIKLIKSRENVIEEIQKSHQEISDKIEGLSIEHHALKFEKREMEKRLAKLEDDKNGDDKGAN